jgi:hypothetical protein
MITGHPDETVRISHKQIDGIERTAYVSGWRYGVVCGLLCGSLTTGLALALLQAALGAL